MHHRPLIPALLVATAVTVVSIVVTGASAQATAPEVTVSVGTATGFRNALTGLSASQSGPHRVELTADILLADDLDPVYTGTQELTVDGNGFTIDGGGLNRIVDAATTTAAIHFVDVALVDADASGATGGAVRAGGGVTLTDSSITSSVSGLGDAIDANDDVTILRSEIGANGGGAAVRVTGGDLHVTESLITDNEGLNGGALWAETFFDGGDVTVERSVLTGNRSTGPLGGGGAVRGSAVTIRDSLLIDNSAQVGGAVLARIATVTNSTVTRNSAVTRGGGIAIGSGINPSLDLVHSTVLANSAPSGANVADDPTNPATLGSVASVVAQPEVGGDCAFTGGTTSSHSVESGTSCAFTAGSDQQGVDDPRLGPLRDNGAGIFTMFPLWDSPVVDVVPAASCEPSVPQDRRGVDRPFGPGCDAGAIERAFPPHGFTDVPPWVEDAVRWMASDVNDPQIMTGITPTTFVPDDPITRAQVARMLYREAGAPDVTALPPHGFTDVAPWAESAVRWVKAEGIMTGITPTLFVPDDPITRAQVVRAKYRFAGQPDVSALPAHGFVDVPAWVEDAVRWASAHEIATGITPTTFVPNDDITRAQVARMDYRLAINPDAWADPEAAPPTLPFTRPALF